MADGHHPWARQPHVVLPLPWSHSSDDSGTSGSDEELRWDNRRLRWAHKAPSRPRWRWDGNRVDVDEALRLELRSGTVLLGEAQARLEISQAFGGMSPDVLVKHAVVKIRFVSGLTPGEASKLPRSRWARQLGACWQALGGPDSWVPLSIWQGHRWASLAGVMMDERRRWERLLRITKPLSLLGGVERSSESVPYS